MSTTYNVLRGDTFERVSRISYGVGTGAYRIKLANPGVSEPLTPGTVLIIPANPSTLRDQPLISTGADVGADGVTILLDGERFTEWESLNLTVSMDSIATAEFNGPFSPDNVDFRDKFRPFSFQDVKINIGSERAFTGTLISISPQVTPEYNDVWLSAYSLPGVLNDCTPTASAELQFDGQGAKDISIKLADIFGIGVDFEVDQGAIFERVGIQREDKILPFLITLFSQRNLIATNSETGNLKVWQAASPGVPVARLTEGAPLMISVDAMFNEQGYYSHITGTDPAKTAKQGGQFTIANPRLQGVIRPLNFLANDTETTGVKSAVESKVGRMFGNMVSYQLQVPTWRDKDSGGKLWAPNTTIRLKAPSVMIYESYEFLIRSVVFDATRDSQIATLTLVLPEAFSNKIPGAMPWDE